LRTVIIKESSLLRPEKRDKILMIKDNKITDLTLEFLDRVSKSKFIDARGIFDEMNIVLETYKHCC
jgi:hypothetical protein